MTIRRKNIFLGIAALLICFAVIFLYRNLNHHEGKIFLHSKSIQSESGWGYEILAGDRVYIKQEIIPGETGKKSFKTEADAMKVANLVIQRISSNQQPTITRKDLSDLGIVVDTSVSAK